MSGRIQYYNFDVRCHWCGKKQGARRYGFQWVCVDCEEMIRPICRSCRRPKKRLPCYFPGVGWLCQSCFDRIVEANIKQNTEHLKDPPTYEDYVKWARQGAPQGGPKILGDPDCEHCKRCAAYETCLKNFMWSQGDCASHREHCGLPHVGSVQMTLEAVPQ